MRIDKTNYYLDIAETVAERSTCLKRHYGAIIVKNDEIISTGFNGAPRGVKDCLESGECNRQNAVYRIPPKARSTGRCYDQDFLT